MHGLIIVRGGGDLASGTIHRLHRAGYRVLVLESAKPTAIRRKAAFCEAVRTGAVTVEGVTARLIRSPEPASPCGGHLEDASQGFFGDLDRCWAANEIPVAVDEAAVAVSLLNPAVVVDAIIAKRNMGTHRDMASLTVALGPGFTAGTGDNADVDVVIETMRGHNLGRLIYDGSAAPDTGIPGMVGGESIRRVMHAPAAGTIHNLAEIGDIVEEGQMIAWIVHETGKTEDEASCLDDTADDMVPVLASLTGVLRGIIWDGFSVWKGMKIADIDPRLEQKNNCRTISDKARAIAGGVLEAVDHFFWQEGRHA